MVASWVEVLQAIGAALASQWFTILGGGLIIAAFHRMVGRQARRLWRAMRRRNRTLPAQTLRSLAPQTVVIESNLSTGFRASQIKLRSRGDYAPPSALRPAMDVFHARAEEGRRSGTDHSHNGHAVGVWGFRIAPDPLEEETAIELSVHEVRYDQVNFIAKHLDDTQIPSLKDAKGTRTSIRQAFAQVDLAKTAPPGLPNPLGVGVLVETSDRWLILCRRKSRVEVAPGKLSISIAEGMASWLGADRRPGDRGPSGHYDINATFRRGLAEELGGTEEGLAELGFEPSRFAELFPIQWVALTASKTYLQFNFTGYCRSKLSRREFERLHAFRAKDKDGDLEFFRKPTALLAHLRKHPGEHISKGPIVLALAYRNNLP